MILVLTKAEGDGCFKTTEKEDRGLESRKQTADPAAAEENGVYAAAPAAVV